MSPQDTSNTQSNAEKENTSKIHSGNSALIQKIPIENTPFHAIGNEQDGYFIAMGNRKLTEQYQVKGQEEFKQLLEYEQWNIVAQMMLVSQDIIQELKELDQKNKGI